MRGRERSKEPLEAYEKRITFFATVIIVLTIMCVAYSIQTVECESRLRINVPALAPLELRAFGVSMWGS